MVEGSRAREWLERLNGSRHALWLITLMSFLETIIVPIPIEVVLIPFMAANRHRIWLIATLVTAGCLLASLLGYGVGYLFFQSAGQWLMDTFAMHDAYAAFQSLFDRHGFWAVIVVGVLPIPFQVAMITAGLSGYPIYLFVTAALVARGIRYYGLAWLVWRYGRQTRQLWDEHAVLTGVGAAVALVAIVASTRYLAEIVI